VEVTFIHIDKAADC